MLNQTTLQSHARDVKLLICDVDGVLTDGSMHYTEQGIMHKTFHVHDGFGLQLLMSYGIHVGVITTCVSPIIAARIKQLGIPHLYQGQRNKIDAYQDLINRLKLSEQDTAYIGDDLIDLPLIIRSKLGIAVANANPTVLSQADWVTTKKGGDGAVREICDLILNSQNALISALEKWQQRK
jgi:3-deoxy-D-manno-octulosonate 8-phosphate phosphatase (KDO 8-P phosphatase)